MLAETIEGWFEEKWRLGNQLGRQQGEGTLLHRLLVRRFGSLSSTIESRLLEASVEQLETWGDRILDAKSLDDVFLDH